METVLFILICVTVLTSDIRGHRPRRFVGGRMARTDQFPYQVSLRHITNNRHFCGGSIIDKQFILTAAHCLYGEDVKDFDVAVGSIFIKSIFNHFSVRNFSIHTNYNDVKLINDIALIKLKEPIVFTKYIKRISLPAFLSDPPEGASMTISGFGRPQYYLDTSWTLQYSTVTAISLTTCRNAIRRVIKLHYISNNHICTFDQNKGFCDGDSGEPLVYNGVQVGIASWAVNICAAGYPDVYVKVASYVKWIEETKSKLEPTPEITTTTKVVETTTKLAETTTALDESTTKIIKTMTELGEYVTELTESETETTESTTELVESTTKLAEFNINELVESTTKLTENKTTELFQSTTKLTASNSSRRPPYINLLNQLINILNL